MIMQLGNAARCTVPLAHVITHMSRRPDSSDAGLDLVFPTHFRPELNLPPTLSSWRTTVGSLTPPCLLTTPHICVFFFSLCLEHSPLIHLSGNLQLFPQGSAQTLCSLWNLPLCYTPQIYLHRRHNCWRVQRTLPTLSSTQRGLQKPTALTAHASATKELIVELRSEINSMKQYERMYNQAPIWAVQILNAKGVERRRKSNTAECANTPARGSHVHSSWK